MPAVQLQRVLASNDRWPGTDVKAELWVGAVEAEADKVPAVGAPVLPPVGVLAVVQQHAVRGLGAERQQDVKVKVDVPQGLEAHVRGRVLREVWHECCTKSPKQEKLELKQERKKKKLRKKLRKEKINKYTRNVTAGLSSEDGEWLPTWQGN